MQVTVNGESLGLAEGTTLGQLLAQRDNEPRTVAVERNGAIVPRDAYGATAIMDGDTIEIVHFVGGG
ncbi:MAG: sulfur carrier protein ThiS [Desulfovibrio sp.]|nr:sulfur carrier protein ThiS [Desulfovibrio sp.]